MKCNRMKQKIARGEPALGCSIMFPSPQIVEMMGYAGFDWVLLDCEHGSIGPGDLEVMAMAAEAAGITAIARPRTNATGDIQHVLDRGVQGVQVPHVNTAAAARDAVASVRFGPGAKRSLAAGTRPDNWGLAARPVAHVQAGVAHQHDELLIAVQIEHEEAVRNIDEILDVPGIDIFFIGPSDLSQSMGFPGNPKASPVAAAIADTLARIRAAGKVPGMPASTEAVGDVVAQGCRYIYTHLPRLIGAGTNAFLAAAGRKT